jgi:hypothetical protein
MVITIATNNRGLILIWKENYIFLAYGNAIGVKQELLMRYYFNLLILLINFFLEDSLSSSHRASIFTSFADTSLLPV